MALLTITNFRVPGYFLFPLALLYKNKNNFKIRKRMDTLGTREILTHFTSLLNGQMSCNGLSNTYSGQSTTFSSFMRVKQLFFYNTIYDGGAGLLFMLI